jgi:high-affinity iron transporter
MNEFIITFRECLEASLIIGIIYTLLEKNNLKRELQQLWLAVFASIIASGVVAVCINYAKESIGNVAIQSLFEGLSMYLTALLLWYVIFWLSKHVSEKSAMEDKTKKAVETAGWFNMSGSFSYLGFFAGMISAILIGYGIVVQGRKINLRAFFRGTTLMLVIFASGMVAYGTHEIEEFIVKGDHLESIGIEQKSEIPRAWNILEPKDEVDNTVFYSYNLKGNNKYTHLLHDNGRVGNFFKGFFGYNSNPNWPEVILWLLSLLFGITMWKSFYFKKK